jgi:hypothetical protein
VRLPPHNVTNSNDSESKEATRYTVTNAKGYYFHCQLNPTRTPHRPVTYSIVMHKSSVSDPAAGRYLLELQSLSEAQESRNTHIGMYDIIHYK